MINGKEIRNSERAVSKQMTSCTPLNILPRKLYIDSEDQNEKIKKRRQFYSLAKKELSTYQAEIVRTELFRDFLFGKAFRKLPIKI